MLTANSLLLIDAVLGREMPRDRLVVPRDCWKGWQGQRFVG